jgi:hypothetical protein
MKRRKETIICSVFVMLFSVVLLFAEDQPPKSAPLGGGDKATINALRSQLKRELSETGKDRQRSVEVRQIRRKLAKMGDLEERMRIIERLKSEDPATQLNAVQDAAYVDGRDMIAALAELLNVTNGYQSVTSGELGPKGERLQGDLVYEPVSLVAAKALAKLVETPPVPPVGKEKKFYTDDDVKKWQKWWEKNKKQYGVE